RLFHESERIEEPMTRIPLAWEERSAPTGAGTGATGVDEALRDRLGTLQLPCGEAPEMEVKSVEAALGGIDGKLNLVLHFVVLDRLATNGARHAEPRSAPRAVGGAPR